LSIPSSQTVGQYLAVPFAFNPRREAVNEALLAGCLHLPNLFPIPGSATERKIAVATWLTDPNHLFWEVWQKGELIGILGVTHIIVGLDATAHLAFFDRQLLGRRQLVLTMVGWAFRELRLQRLTVEIPETLEPLIRFVRVKLGFRYEGEDLAAAHPEVRGLEARRINGPARWVAKFGARKEHGHWDGTAWRDLVRLRLLKEELPTG
jgi:RimJ/RimL family protein N-acetyltransferase